LNVSRDGASTTSLGNPGFEYLQGWRAQKPSGLPVLDHPYGNKAVSYVYMEFPVFQYIFSLGTTEKSLLLFSLSAPQQVLTQC